NVQCTNNINNAILKRELRYWWLFFVFCLGTHLPVNGQSVWSWQIGFVAKFGQPVQRLGITAGFSWQNAYMHLGTTWLGLQNLRAIGTQQYALEHQLRIRLRGGWRDRSLDQLPVFNVLDQWPVAYRFGYQWNWYWDDQGTSQETGTLLVGLHAWDIQIENDALALIQPRDRFRTGAFSIQWIAGYWQFGTQVILWHGEGNGAPRCTNPDYPCPYGYKDLKDRPYGRCSHGIWQFTAQRSLGQGQTTGLALGLDSEQIRHFWQNRLIHDLPFIPLRWNKARNPHYPMLDQDGAPYLFSSNQVLRRSRLTWSWNLNDHTLY
ncbi:MAG: polymorphic toxin type 23 domain-containing protein, partial [Bacteroidota bacterium]